MPLPEAKALSSWLAERESRVPALRVGAAKRIDWAGAQGAVTPVSVVYVHGFSASAHELSPVPEDMARALGANLFVTRLAGHGQDGAALGAATVEEWVHDTQEAFDIGRRIGRRVIMMGNSTGATLIALIMAAGADVAGAALIAPNFGIKGALVQRLIDLPLARHWVPLIMGRTRRFDIESEAHAVAWTTQYPIRVVFEVAEAVRRARRIDYGRLTAPAFFAFTETDEVVEPKAIHRVMARWGGPVTHHAMTVGPGMDPRGHLVAGDIFSPGQNGPLTAALVDWARGAGLAG